LSRGRELWPFAALSASYFAHIGFFNPYLPLWLKDAGVSLFAISLLTSMQSATRLFAPYAWGWVSDHTGERVRLLRFCAMVALACSAGFWLGLGLWGLAVVLLLMFTHTSAMMPMSEAAMAHRVSRSGSFDSRLYGRVRLCGSAGFLLTVVAAGAWFEARGMGGFPAWTAGTLALVVASAWWMPDEGRAHAAPPHKGFGGLFHQHAHAVGQLLHAGLLGQLRGGRASGPCRRPCRRPGRRAHAGRARRWRAGVAGRPTGWPRWR
jgi:MFS transporter, PPP family, 3-phenylpropionic acid transporter